MIGPQERSLKDGVCDSGAHTERCGRQKPVEAGTIPPKPVKSSANWQLWAPAAAWCAAQDCCELKGIRGTAFRLSASSRPCRRDGYLCRDQTSLLRSRHPSAVACPPPVDLHTRLFIQNFPRPAKSRFDRRPGPGQRPLRPPAVRRHCVGRATSGWPASPDCSGHLGVVTAETRRHYDLTRAARLSACRRQYRSAFWRIIEPAFSEVTLRAALNQLPGMIAALLGVALPAEVGALPSLSGICGDTPNRRPCPGRIRPNRRVWCGREVVLPTPFEQMSERQTDTPPTAGVPLLPDRTSRRPIGRRRASLPTRASAVKQPREQHGQPKNRVGHDVFERGVRRIPQCAKEL